MTRRTETKQKCNNQNMAASILLVFIFINLMMRLPTEARERVGCFSFKHNNTVLSVQTQNVGSIEECIHQCQHRRATYAGIRNGFQCYCGDNHDHAVNGRKLSDSSCTTSCNDQAPHCGGQFSIVIYSVCSRGRYRDSTYSTPNCDALCNCKDNHICLYHNGRCPANCETGWRGEACNVRVDDSTTFATTLEPKPNVTNPTNNGVSVSSNTTILLDKGAKVTVPGKDQSKSVEDDEDGISVTAVAVGVSLAVIVLVVIIALIVLFRRRRKPHKSGDAIDDGVTNPEVKAEDSTAKQTENGPTIYTDTELLEPCYSSVDYLNNGPIHIDGEDIPKSDDDVAINGEAEMVEYAVVKKPGDARHVNLKENSLYGTNAGDSDEEGQE